MKKSLKYIKIALLIIMIVLVYLVSPKITVAIQNLAKLIYELDGTYITRVVELILAVSFIVTVFTMKGEKKNGK